MRSVIILALSLFVNACGNPYVTHARRVLLHDDTGSIDDKGNPLTGNAEVVEKPENRYYNIHALGGFETRPINIKIEERVSSEIRNGIIKAGETWNQAVGFELLKFEGNSPNYKGNLYDRIKDLISTIGIERHWCRTGKKPLVLGTTLWDYSKVDPDKITTADIILNSDVYTLGDSTKDKPIGQKEIVDIESLVLHELGHLLGLSHVSLEQDPTSIMNPSLYIGEGKTTRTLSEFDIARIRFLYVSGSPHPPIFNEPPYVPIPVDPNTPTPPPYNPPPPPPCDWDSDS